MSENNHDHYGILEDQNITIEVEINDGSLKNISGFHRYLIFQGNVHKEIKGKIYEIADEGLKFHGYIDPKQAVNLIKRCNPDNRGAGTVIYEGRWRLWDWEKDGERKIKKI